MLFNLFSKQESEKKPWEILDRIEQLDEITQLSKDKPIVLFKHSTSCMISKTVLSRFVREYKNDALFGFFYLDLIAYRNISNEIASRYKIHHESPQLLLIQDGEMTYTASHTLISYGEVNKKVSTE